MAFPTNIVAGDSATWTEEDTTGDADAVSYAIRDEHGAGWVGKGSLSAGVYTFTLSRQDSATLAPGRYQVARIVENATERETTIKSADFIVYPDISAEAPPSYNARMVESLRAALENRAPAGIESSSVNGISVNKLPIAEQQRLLAIYEARLARETDKARVARGAKSRRTVQIQF